MHAVIIVLYRVSDKIDDCVMFWTNFRVETCFIYHNFVRKVTKYSVFHFINRMAPTECPKFQTFPLWNINVFFIYELLGVLLPRLLLIPSPVTVVSELRFCFSLKASCL